MEGGRRHEGGRGKGGGGRRKGEGGGAPGEPHPQLPGSASWEDPSMFFGQTPSDCGGRERGWWWNVGGDMRKGGERGGGEGGKERGEEHLLVKVIVGNFHQMIATGT